MVELKLISLLHYSTQVEPPISIAALLGLLMVNGWCLLWPPITSPARSFLCPYYGLKNSAMLAAWLSLFNQETMDFGKWVFL